MPVSRAAREGLAGKNWLGVREVRGENPSATSEL